MKAAGFLKQTIVVFAVTVIAAEARAGVMFVNAAGNDYRVASVTDLSIGGRTFDATFHHGTSYDSLVDPITFPIATDARLAVEALVSAIDPVVPSAPFGSRTQFFYVPWAEFFFTSLNRDDVRTAIGNDFNGTYQFLGFSNAPQSSVPAQNAAYVTFSEVSGVSSVPEPTSLVVYGIGALCSFGYRRRRGSA